MFIATRLIEYSRLQEPAVIELPQPEEFVVTPGISEEVRNLKRGMKITAPELGVGSCFILNRGSASNMRIAKVLKVLERSLGRTFEVVTVENSQHEWIHISGVHIDEEKCKEHSQLQEPAVKELPQPEKFLVIPGILNQALLLERVMREEKRELEVGTCFKLNSGRTSNLRRAKILKVLETLLDRTLEVVTEKNSHHEWIHITGIHDFGINREKCVPGIGAGAGAGAASGFEALATAVAAALRT